MKNIKLMQTIFWQWREVKALLLSDRQVDILIKYASNSFTSKLIAENYDICVQNASQQLSNLFRKGYLERDEKQDPTGGVYYEYKVTPALYKDGFK